MGAEAREPARPGRTAAVVVHYRCLEETLACLESLERHAPALEVFLVENGSRDGSRKALEEAASAKAGLHLVFSGENRGFGGGCNLGIEAALEKRPDLEFLLLLNPDCLAERGFLEALEETARRRRAAITGAKILSADGERILYENGRIRPLTLAGSHAPAPEGMEEYETEFITGACMLVDAAFLRGGLRFDEEYFLYVEDMDFCLRARAMGGRLWVTRRARIRHALGGSQREDEIVPGGMRRKEIYFLARNKVRLARKWFTPGRRAAFLAVAFLLKPPAGALRFGSLRFLGPYFRGLLDGLAGRPSRAGGL